MDINERKIARVKNFWESFEFEQNLKLKKLKFDGKKQKSCIRLRTKHYVRHRTKQFRNKSLNTRK